MNAIRPNLDTMKVDEWTKAEAHWHLVQTFNTACKWHPDLMEPYMIQLAEAIGEERQMEVMRQGLRSTFNERYPAAN